MEENLIKKVEPVHKETNSGRYKSSNPNRNGNFKAELERCKEILESQNKSVPNSPGEQTKKQL